MLDFIAGMLDSYIEEVNTLYQASNGNTFPDWAYSPAEEMNHRELMEGVSPVVFENSHFQGPPINHKTDYEPFGVDWIMPKKPIFWFDKVIILCSLACFRVTRFIKGIQDAY